MSKLNDKINEQNKFTMDDAKEIASDVYENKPRFYGVATGIGSVVLLGVDILSGVGLGAMTAFGYGMYKKNQGKK